MFDIIIIIFVLIITIFHRYTHTPDDPVNSRSRAMSHPSPLANVNFNQSLTHPVMTSVEPNVVGMPATLAAPHTTMVTQVVLPTLRSIPQRSRSEQKPSHVPPYDDNNYRHSGTDNHTLDGLYCNNLGHSDGGNCFPDSSQLCHHDNMPTHADVPNLQPFPHLPRSPNTPNCSGEEHGPTNSTHAPPIVQSAPNLSQTGYENDQNSQTQNPQQTGVSTTTVRFNPSVASQMHEQGDDNNVAPVPPNSPLFISNGSGHPHSNRENDTNPPLNPNSYPHFPPFHFDTGDYPRSGNDPTFDQNGPGDAPPPPGDAPLPHGGAPFPNGYRSAPPPHRDAPLPHRGAPFSDRGPSPPHRGAPPYFGDAPPPHGAAPSSNTTPSGSNLGLYAGGYGYSNNGHNMPPPSGGPPDGVGGPPDYGDNSGNGGRGPPGGPNGPPGPSGPPDPRVFNPSQYDPFYYMNLLRSSLDTLSENIQRSDQQKLEKNRISFLFHNQQIPNFNPAKDKAESYIWQFDLYLASTHTNNDGDRIAGLSFHLYEHCENFVQLF